jgi:lysophospholipase L1-like esterase
MPYHLGYVPPDYLRLGMTRWDAVRSGTSVIALIGDSITRGTYWAPTVRASLVATYGSAGDGWMSASLGAPSWGGTVSSAGTWTASNKAATSRGVDLTHASSTDTGTPASLTFTSTATSFVIHYLKQANGGSFRYRVDSGGWTTVATANASNLFATETVSGLSSASHTLTIEVTVAGVAGVVICGVDAQKSGNGVRIHNLGNSSSATSHWLAVDATIWQAGLAALAPDVVLICLGPNDRGAGGLSPQTWQGNMEAIAARVRSATATADIVFVTPIDQGFSATGTMWQWAETLYQSARRKSYPLINTHVALGEYTEANANGYYADTTHPSNSGGALIASRVTSFLTA